VTAPGTKDPEETEIKVPVADLVPIRTKLVAEGARSHSEPHLERNVLFDDAKGHLIAEKKALRVRHARGRGILTFKGPARFDGPIKRREELEVEVGDPDLLQTILERLGYVAKFRYEKRREEFRWKNCLVALDETPIGFFVEIEGETEAIGEALSGLGLRAEDAVRKSYAGLYREAREKDRRLPPDMLFPGSGR
jgi:adenylate cyclase class 2